MTARRNEGIVNRGTITGHAIAVGRGAQATATVDANAEVLRDAGHADVAARLDELNQQIVSHADAIADFDEVVDVLRTVAEELTTEKPNRLTIRGLLDGVASSLRSVGGVAQAAAALKAAVEAML